MGTVIPVLRRAPHDSVTDPVFACWWASETDSDLKALPIERMFWLPVVLRRMLSIARFTDGRTCNHVYLLCWRACRL